jgi:hypothetical protein
MGRQRGATMTERTNDEIPVATSPAAGAEDGSADELDQARADERREANHYLAAGLGIGAFGAASALLVGAVCPVCVVAAPALVAAGAYKRIRARKRGNG